MTDTNNKPPQWMVDRANAIIKTWSEVGSAPAFVDIIEAMQEAGREVAFYFASQERTKPKCDGNHAGPPCRDPECWAIEDEDQRLYPDSAKPAGERGWVDEEFDLKPAAPAPSAKPAGKAIKAAYVRKFGSDEGWLSRRGSWFIEGYLAAAPAPSPVDDKSHPRFMAGYDAGLHDRELERQSLKGGHPAEPVALTEAELIQAMCARIKAADDAAANNDYMLDSNDCISVLRGTWKGPLQNDCPPAPAEPAAPTWPSTPQILAAWQVIEQSVANIPEGLEGYLDDFSEAMSAASVVFKALEARTAEPAAQSADAVDASDWQIWCDTCEGSGNVYQEHQAGCNVGGEHPCPACTGKGYFVKRLAALAAPAVQPVAQSATVTDRQILDACSGIFYADFEGEDYDLAIGRAVLALAAPALQESKAVTDEEMEKVCEAVAGALGSAYDCLRVWSAWSHGTMRADDFALVSEDIDRVSEIAQAAVLALAGGKEAGE